MKAMRRKSQALPLVRGKDDCGYCREFDIGCSGRCELRNRCKLLCEVEVEVTNDNGSDTGWAVVIEAYRIKSAKYALWKYLDSQWAHSSNGFPLCYSEAEALGISSFGDLVRRSRITTATRLSDPYCIASKIDGTLKGKEKVEVCPE